MFVNSINRTPQVNFQERAANIQSGISAQNKSALPEDTLTLSPAAQALQTEQKLAAAAAQDVLSPAAQTLQTEQKLAATAATLWMSALSLISD